MAYLRWWISEADARGVEELEREGKNRIFKYRCADLKLPHPNLDESIFTVKGDGAVVAGMYAQKQMLCILLAGVGNCEIH